MARRAFTLIELILVLALLATIAAFAAPSLGGFLRGRTLDEEARRVVAMAHYARSQAMACGVPVEMWIDPENSQAGVRAVAGFEDDAILAYSMRLSDRVVFELDDEHTAENGMGVATFLPDGTMDADSLEALTVRDGGGEIEVRRSEFRPAYEAVSP